MVYLLENNLKAKKKVFGAFTEIYGLGKHTCLQVCDMGGYSQELRLAQLSPLQLQQINQLITQNYKIGLEKKQILQGSLERLIKIACYRGFRHNQGLPVRGQRTHGNSRTSRRLKKKV